MYFMSFSSAVWNIFSLSNPRHKNMDVSGCALPDTINPNNFPAKLWRLVNNPAYTAICWDRHGEGILIDKQLFERQILSPDVVFPDSADTFKTTNFSSFIRQLNLYGFRKAELMEGDSQLSPRGSVEIHHFFNPSFKRSHPELVGSLRRLTANNKAKMEAGEDISCRPPSKQLRFSGPDSNGERNVKRSKFEVHSFNSPCSNRQSQSCKFDVTVIITLWQVFITLFLFLSVSILPIQKSSAWDGSLWNPSPSTIPDKGSWCGSFSLCLCFRQRDTGCFQPTICWSSLKLQCSAHSAGFTGPCKPWKGTISAGLLFPR